MKFTKHYISGFFKVLLLILFVGYDGSITLFYHAHLVNGNIVFHSHPFKHDHSGKDPFQKHHHSSSEYLLIQQLNASSWEDTSVTPGVTDAIYTSVTHAQPLVFPLLPFQKQFSNLLRAPPIASIHI